MTKHKRVRKPDRITILDGQYEVVLGVGTMRWPRFVYCDDRFTVGDPKELRRLSAWLLRAAAWIEAGEK